MPIPEEFLLRLKQANDIVTAFGPYAELKHAGRDYVCLCPFHSEKSPSCHIYTDTASFYCFGCGAGGDVITFTMMTEGLDYISAVRLLAERSGYAMPDDTGGDETLRKRAKILEMNKEAARFFRDRLMSESGVNGLGYLYGRGLTPNTVRKYGLGFAPDSYNALKNHMNAAGYNDYELLDASLLARGNKGVYDKFRNRVMFPIINRMGEVIAFSGRVLSEDGYGPKYLNSAETQVFKKRENLFSINFAKNSKKSRVILCEGNLDVISLNQAGFDNAVATLGTAITPEQARLLRNYCGEVVIAYDMDAAGEKATVKAINLFAKEGVTARVLQMDGAKDPDEYIRRYGAEKFADLIEKSGSAISFELEKFKSGEDMNTPEGRAEYIKKAVVLLSEVENRIDRAVYISKIARDCDITAANVEQAVEEKIRIKSRAKLKQQRKELLRPQIVRGGVNPESERFPTAERAESGVIAFLFHSPDKLPVVLKNLTPDDFPTSFNRKLFETLILRLHNGQTIDISSLGGEFSAEETGRIEKIKIENAVLPFTDERLNDYIKTLADFRDKRGRKNAADMSNEEVRDFINSRAKKLLKT